MGRNSPFYNMVSRLFAIIEPFSLLRAYRSPRSNPKRPYLLLFILWGNKSRPSHLQNKADKCELEYQL
jgi:hypothetical protein